MLKPRRIKERPNKKYLAIPRSSGFNFSLVIGRTTSHRKINIAAEVSTPTMPSKTGLFMVSFLSIFRFDSQQVLAFLDQVLNRGAELLGIAFGFLNRAFVRHFGITVGPAHFFFDASHGRIDDSRYLVVMVFPIGIHCFFLLFLRLYLVSGVVFSIMDEL